MALYVIRYPNGHVTTCLHSRHTSIRNLPWGSEVFCTDRDGILLPLPLKRTREGGPTYLQYGPKKAREKREAEKLKASPWRERSLFEGRERPTLTLVEMAQRLAKDAGF